jgi:hypothetical protein
MTSGFEGASPAVKPGVGARYHERVNWTVDVPIDQLPAAAAAG